MQIGPLFPLNASPTQPWQQWCQQPPQHLMHTWQGPQAGSVWQNGRNVGFIRSSLFTPCLHHSLLIKLGVGSMFLNPDRFFSCQSRNNTTSFAAQD